MKESVLGSNAMALLSLTKKAHSLAAEITRPNDHVELSIYIYSHHAANDASPMFRVMHPRRACRSLKAQQTGCFNR